MGSNENRLMDKQFFQKREEVLSRIMDNSIGANQTFALLIQLRDFYVEHNDLFSVAPQFFNTIAFNCMQVVLVEIYKMFDTSKDNEGIRTFIEKTKKGINQLDNSVKTRANFIASVFDMSAKVKQFDSLQSIIDFSEKAIKENSELLDRVDKLRCKYYAHHDPDVKDVSKLFERYQLTFDDVERLLVLNWNLCNAFKRYFSGCTVRPLPHNYNDCQRMFNMLIEKKEDMLASPYSKQ